MNTFLLLASPLLLASSAAAQATFGTAPSASCSSFSQTLDNTDLGIAATSGYYFRFNLPSPVTSAQELNTPQGLYTHSVYLRITTDDTLLDLDDLDYQIYNQQEAVVSSSQLDTSSSTTSEIIEYLFNPLDDNNNEYFYLRVQGSLATVATASDLNVDYNCSSYEWDDFIAAVGTAIAVGALLLWLIPTIIGVLCCVCIIVCIVCATRRRKPATVVVQTTPAVQMQNTV